MSYDDLYFANLSWPEIERLKQSDRKTVLLLPVGATEPHGPHAPLATDVIISEGMCRRAAARLRHDPEMRALILPPVHYGVTRYTRGFAGAIHINENTLLALIVDICNSLIDQGFQYIMVVNNHFEPEHIQTLHASLDRVAADRGVVIGYLDLTRKHRAAALTEEFRKGECHAGCYETSLVLADRPELVDRVTMASLPYVPVNLVTAIGQGLKDFRDMGMPQAYNGAPAQATDEEGRRTFEILTDMLVGLMRDLVRGEGGRDAAGFYQRV